MTPQSDTLSWFWANWSLLFHLNAACLSEKQQIHVLILISLVWPDLGSHPRSTELEASMLTITSSMRLNMIRNYCFPLILHPTSNMKPFLIWIVFLFAITIVLSLVKKERSLIVPNYSTINNKSHYKCLLLNYLSTMALYTL